MEFNFYELAEMVFPYLMGSVVVWFFLIFMLIRKLKIRHPETYEQLERPRFLGNQGALPLLKYLILLKWRKSNDVSLKNLCWFMFVFLVVYTILFLSLWFGMLFTAF